MNRIQAPKIEVQASNPTLRNLMRDAIKEAGLELQPTAASPVIGGAGAALADLLLFDAEGPDDALESRLQDYLDAGGAVLFCGLRNSRDRYPDAQWLERPFSPAILQGKLLEMLELDQLPRDTTEASDATLPEDSSSDTKRLTINETIVLEEALGLEKGKISDELSLDEPAAEPADAVLSRGVVAGGEMMGAVRRRPIDPADLQADASLVAALKSDAAASGLRSMGANATLPDVPAVKRASVQERAPARPTPPPRPGSDVGSGPARRVGSAPERGAYTQVSGVSVAPQFEPKLRGAAALLAGAWAQIGCSAREDDRREHIEKVMRATFARGLQAGEAQVLRIPAAPSFSGSLAVLSLVDLLATIRDRTLRGRLELAIGAEYFVLYVDAQALDEVENLTGNDEQLLLDILAKMGCLVRADYDALSQSLSDPLAPPLRMQLRERRVVSTTQATPQTPTDETRPLVDEDDLREARRLRTLHLFRKIRHAERTAAQPGSFAFMEILASGNHAWPFAALGLNVDELLKSARREDSTVGGGPSESGLY
ncbi:hypothetical protein [Bradymonas sediminis]|uniref:Uncharacterized protein n=1 Tax=Bradymonas sediminis TaxID=1548548 RepID=A0A2Z4FIV9_9DELT|nr:hypothetical protein [Bradymonas sediminis]AWV88991.1 hypothetical protein DN745_06405 [Bradymonas sediminis]TDP72004.1 hypothetical protein DFR33_108218 [Bradymonas sediminis]